MKQVQNPNCTFMQDVAYLRLLHTILRQQKSDWSFDRTGLQIASNKLAQMNIRRILKSHWLYVKCTGNTQRCLPAMMKFTWSDEVYLQWWTDW
jgi:hypothetical protein